MNNQVLNNQMFEEYCYNRLPCGICRLTNSQCPKCAGTTINWSNDITTDATNLKDSKITSTKYTTKLGDVTAEVHIS